jgi:hypothetical protein
MVINTLYSKYFQKSKIFLYPLLGIKRGTSVIPDETYLSWNSKYNPEDMKLVCVYKTRTDSEYINFENNFLLKHNRLYDYVKTNDSNSVFIFDFSDYSNDWKCFLNGKYSKLDNKTKNKILDFFEKNSGNYVYVHSFLYPNKWFERYAELLAVDVDLLKEVGELCDKPNFDKENLLIEVANLENLKILD